MTPLKRQKLHNLTPLWGPKRERFGIFMELFATESIFTNGKGGFKPGGIYLRWWWRNARVLCNCLSPAVKSAPNS